MTITSACFENEINNACKCALNSSVLYRYIGRKVRKLPCCTVLNVLQAQYFSDLKIFLVFKLTSWLTKIGYPSIVRLYILHGTLEAILLSNKKIHEYVYLITVLWSLFKILPTPLISVDYDVPHTKQRVSALWKLKCLTNLKLGSPNDRKKGWFLTTFDNRRNSGGGMERRGRISQF